MRWYRAPAKVNLTLKVIGRRADGLHDIESLVAFADEADWLGFAPNREFELIVEGPLAQEIGPLDDNLVARAARALSGCVPDLRLGKFRLIKRLPAAAGLGGGSSDAAACIRALAEANGLLLSDERVRAAAADTGADVPVCLAASARFMAGVGDVLGPPVRLPSIFAVLVNPRRMLSTRDVFAALGMERGFRRDLTGQGGLASDRGSSPVTLEAMASGGNDLEIAAEKVLPLVGEMLHELRPLPGARLARMSGSGATCFALFDLASDAKTAEDRLVADHPDWWITTTTLR